MKVGPMAMDADWLPVSHSLLALPGAPDWIGALSLRYRIPQADGTLGFAA